MRKFITVSSAPAGIDRNCIFLSWVWFFHRESNKNFTGIHRFVVYRSYRKTNSERIFNVAGGRDVKRPYKLEILWSTGDLTESRITEAEKDLIEEYGSLYILTKYELEGEPNARPVSYQVWDKNDNPLIPIDTQSRAEESASA